MSFDLADFEWRRLTADTGRFDEIEIDKPEFEELVRRVYVAGMEAAANTIAVDHAPAFICIKFEIDRIRATPWATPIVVSR